MAGGKETPRQKLIGMMYLVLLALLALQVGAEIMVKFNQLNDSFQTTSRYLVSKLTNNSLISIRPIEGQELARDTGTKAT